jgi:hypothetical protein
LSGARDQQHQTTDIHRRVSIVEPQLVRSSKSIIGEICVKFL